MANPYPVELDVGGVVTESGTLTFTDPANQPGGSSSSVIPTADTQAVTLDTTTYDNNVLADGSKLATLVFEEDTVAIAIAKAGDAFPRLLILSDPTDGVYMADGTVEPYYDGAKIDVFLDSGGNYGIAIPGFTHNSADSIRGDVTSLDGSVVVGNGNAGSGGALSFCAGAPTHGGFVGDIAIRTDGGVGSTIYQCTVTGAAGLATWAAIL